MSWENWEVTNHAVLKNKQDREDRSAKTLNIRKPVWAEKRETQQVQAR